MPVINPYLNFPGTAEAAFNLYKSVFGGQFATVQRYKDLPQGPPVSDAEKDKLMHIALPIGKGNVLMATDTLQSQGQPLVEGNNFFLTISADSKEEADKIYNGLSAGGKATMPMQNQFWGAYFGMLTDKFGIRWSVSYEASRT